MGSTELLQGGDYMVFGSVFGVHLRSELTGTPSHLRLQRKVDVNAYIYV